MNATPHFYDPAPGPDNPGATALYGHVTAMLVAGGHWPGDPVPPFYGKQGERRTKPRQVEYYQGEHFTEPEPSISNLKSTSKLIKRMVSHHGWSRRQVIAALSDEKNVGGSYFRFRCAQSPEAGLRLADDLISGSWEAGAESKIGARASQASTCSDSEDSSSSSSPDSSSSSSSSDDYVPITTYPMDIRSNTKQREKKIETWRVQESGFTLSMRASRDLVMWVRRENNMRELQGQDPLTFAETQRSGVVSPKVCAYYLAALVDAGLLTKTARKLRRGETKVLRTCQVIETADAETASLMLSAHNLPPEDRGLWKLLEPAKLLPARSADYVPETFEDFTARIVETQQVTRSPAEVPPSPQSEIPRPDTPAPHLHSELQAMALNWPDPEQLEESCSRPANRLPPRIRRATPTALAAAARRSFEAPRLEAPPEDWKPCFHSLSKDLAFYPVRRGSLHLYRALYGPQRAFLRLRGFRWGDCPAQTFRGS